MNKFSLTPLPYAIDALEPHISAKTLEFHHGKHHQTYVTNLNNFLEHDPVLGETLVEVIKNSYNKNPTVFNNAAQVFNHDFYWQSMKPDGGGKPFGSMSHIINDSFGSYDNFRTEFKQAASSQFGSGWAWLVLSKDKLIISKTPNADLPLVYDDIPLLNCDVWEHAYYLDYQNRRVEYIDIFLDHLLNWDFALLNYSKQTRHG